MDRNPDASFFEGTPRCCELCPRRCRAARAAGERGVCGAADEIRVARAALHMWEEPPISGTAGSGAIFFSGCSMACVYCQNQEISVGGFGVPISSARLVEIMLELQDAGAANINLVTATHYAWALPDAVSTARRRGLDIPIVYNTSGYERVSALRALTGTVDVWLTDFKYADGALAGRLSGAPDYPEIARRALIEMASQVERGAGELFDKAGMLKRGLIVRHLVLPGHVDDSLRVLDLIWKTAGDVAISVMNQYTPNNRMRAQGGALCGPLADADYERVLDHADDLGFSTMYWQQGGTVGESFIPPFDATGVAAREEEPASPQVRKSPAEGEPL
ncbi:4Fe-4S cluster-binding domain-containing protein [Coriobacterium glomerans]|nr:4Fe-4S cluster-binding domain-containing protein [Coriobacterium glomerans]